MFLFHIEHTLPPLFLGSPGYLLFKNGNRI